LQFQSTDEKDVYYRMGIIDFLQKYGKRKRIEYRTLKMLHPNVPANEFSCQPTKEYGDRFYNFMKDNLFS
jgi:Phosphatidylinositol-4-phosphate 5-Kinase